MHNSGKLIILGSGGFGRELYQWVLDINSHGGALEVLGFLDDSTPVDTDVAGQRVLGHLAKVWDYPGVRFALAVNTPSARQRLVETLDLPDTSWVDIIHPSATRGERCEAGPGLIMCPHSGISVDIKMGCHVQLNSRCGIGHDAVLGDYCSLGPNSIVLGGAKLGDRVYLGSNSVVLPNAKLGNDVTIGANSNAMKTVPNGVTIYGSPGKRL